MLGLLVCAAVAGLSLWPAVAAVRTDDRNGDGRPDVWRTYDRQGHLIAQDIDTNFDGRSDIHEHYQHGQLIQRASDRNFDDRVDLVEEFDVTTHEHVRSVEDRDFDGAADLLVLFQGGRPVFSKSAPLGVEARNRRQGAGASHKLVSRQGNTPIAELSDPFSSELALRGASVAPDTTDGVWTTVGVPVLAGPAIAEIRFDSAHCGVPTPSRVSAVVRLRSPRGPPSQPRFA